MRIPHSVTWAGNGEISTQGREARRKARERNARATATARRSGTGECVILSYLRESTLSCSRNRSIHGRTPPRIQIEGVVVCTVGGHCLHYTTCPYK
eukprot:4761305-Pyramimonas_sp.AAC.3